MQKLRTLFVLTIAAIFMVAVATVGAQEPLYPIGKINLEATSVKVGIGIQWGKGTLSFKGKDYPIKVTGLNLVGVGITKVTATGDVYNLKQVSDIEGNYLAAGAGVALAGGVKGTVGKNQNGVFIDLKATQKGISLSIGPGGYTIKLK